MIKYKVSYTVSATISGEHTLYSTGAEDVQHTFDSIADLTCCHISNPTFEAVT